MNIHNIQIHLRNRSLDEIFDFSFLLLRKNLMQYIKLLIVPILVFAGFNIVFPLIFDYTDTKQDFDGPAQYFMISLLFFEKTIISIFLVIHNGHFLFNHKPSKRKIWMEVIKSAPRYIWHQVILRGLYILILPWTIILPWRSSINHFFKSEVILLEKLEGPKMNQRLSVMSHGHNDRILLFWFFDLLFFISYLFVFYLTYNQILSIFQLDDRYWWLDANLKYMFLSPPVIILFLPYFIFHSIAKFLFYIDTRSQREGWDIELQLLRGLGHTGEINEKQ